MSGRFSAGRVATGRGGPPGAGETALRVLILGGLASIAPFSMDTYLPALPSVAGDLHTGSTSVQLTITTFVVGMALGQLVAGPLSDRWGRRRPLLVGLGVYVLASLLCAFAPSVGALAALRAVQGASGAAGIAIGKAVVTDLYEGRTAARFYSRLLLVSGFAPIIAPIIGGQVLRFTSWRGVFVVLAALGLLLVSGVALRLDETRHDKRRTQGISGTLRVFAGMVRDRAFLAYSLAYGLALMALFAYLSGSPFVYQVVFRTTPQVFSLLFCANAVGFLLSGQANGYLLKRVAPRRLLVGGLAVALCSGVALLVAAVSGRLGIAGAEVPLFVLMSSFGFILPNSTALVMALHPEDAGSAAAVSGTLGFVGGALAAPLVGLAGAGSDLPMAIVIAASSAAALGICLLMTRNLPIGSVDGYEAASQVIA